LKELVYAITALIWSPPDCLNPDRLELKPSPAAVKKAVLEQKRKSKKTSGA